MNELPLDNSSAELLSAPDIATLLKITPRAVRLRLAGIQPQLRDGIRAWPITQLPPDYQAQLQFARKRSGLWTYADMLVQAVPRWKPDFKFSTLPEFSQLKAFKVRDVMLVYFGTLDADGTAHQANCAARSKWLEVFAEACNEKTIRRWAQKIEERGGIEYAAIEAFADRKSCPHVNARLEVREKLRVSGETIREFKWRCIQPDMNVAAAHRAMEDDWKNGKSVAGIEPMSEINRRFPFTASQLRKFAPGGAARKAGNKGKAAALRDSLPHMVRTHANLRPCELYVMDDTRINVVTLNDETGKRVELKCYIAMEVASRRIVGYVLREGHMQASDVDTLTSRVLRTCGIAHPLASYKTTLLFERGTVACSSQRETYIEALLGGRVKIKRTSMDGGKNFDGDYAQAGSGHWMGKGAIESFMRTLGYFCKRIAGQRGSTYKDQPAMVGHPGEQGAHAGSMVREAENLAQAARAVAYLESGGVDTAPNSLEACKALGLELPLLHTSLFRQEFARAIECYNSTVGHRREGFRQIARDKPNGGLIYESESSNERWSYLLHQAEQNGTAPERISPAVAVMLLHKAKPVTVRKNGAFVQVDGVTYRFFCQDSVACAEAAQLTDVEKRFIAVIDEENLSEIHILQNPVGAWKEGDMPRFLEALPFCEKTDYTDSVALGKAYNVKQAVLNRTSYELKKIAAPFIKERSDVLDRNLNKFRHVAVTTGSVHNDAAVSQGLKDMKRQRMELREKREEGTAPSPSRHPAAPDDLAAFAASLKSENP